MRTTLVEREAWLRARFIPLTRPVVASAARCGWCTEYKPVALFIPWGPFVGCACATCEDRATEQVRTWWQTRNQPVTFPGID